MGRDHDELNDYMNRVSNNFWTVVAALALPLVVAMIGYCFAGGF